jgi:uncharacterized FAD-dependent dehydrogenase
LNKNYIFIGAGAATIYSALWLLEHGVDGQDIIIVEKGKSSINNDSSDILHNVGGCGLISDAKMVFNTREQLNIIKYLGIDEVDQWYSFLQKQIIKFHPDPSTIHITEPTEFSNEVKEGWGETALDQALVWHIGSDWGFKLMEQIENYLISNNVQLMLESTVLTITPDENSIEVQNNIGLQYYIGYDNLFVATGRANSKFVNKFLKANNIDLQKTYLDIGCRFEIEYTDKVREISDKQYDFKFNEVISITKPIHCRSFCVCHYSSAVTEELKNGQFIGFNGHGYGMNSHENATNLTNFGILAHLTDIDAHSVMQMARENKCQVLGSEFNFKSSIKLNDVKSKEYLLTLPAGPEILAFVDKLKPILGFGENYKIHYPEIKEGSGKIESSLKWQLEQFPNIYFTGDSSFSMYDGGTRGIIPAAVSGLSAVSIAFRESSNDNI